MLTLAAIYWDPRPEAFRLPFFDWPVLWYGILFALGFAIGFPVFVGILTRFLGKEPVAKLHDSGKSKILSPIEEERLRLSDRADGGLPERVGEEARTQSGSKGRFYASKSFATGSKDQKKKAIQITDRLTLYMILGTVIGARLGHFLFYERPAHYLNNPLEIFRIWEGGLASHGGALGIIAALFLFSLRIRSIEPDLNWVRLLDFVSVPAAFGGFCIRIGNFINQEILGTPTDLPWAVVFGHPADRSPPIPRHPVQIYEALFYLAVFFFLYRLSFRPSFFKLQGKLIGLFLVLVFGFRFLIEFLKPEQSRLLSSSTFTMGQILSIPLVIAGLLFYFWKRK